MPLIISIPLSYFQRADLKKKEQYLMQWTKSKVNRAFVLCQQINYTRNMLNSSAALGNDFCFTKNTAFEACSINCQYKLSFF